MAVQMNLKAWQIEALKKWEENNSRGTVEAGTGAGKSFLFLKVIQDNPNAKILVVVPTQHLMIQHYNLILKELNIKSDMVGMGLKEVGNNVCVGVINSIRERETLLFDILVLDEAHRYFSLVNKLVLNHNYKKVLLLTATIHRQDNQEQEFLKQYPVVYNYSQSDCIQDGLINNYEILNKGVKLNSEEQKQFDIIDAYIKENFRHFNYDLKQVQKLLFINPVARELMRKINERKQLLYNAEAKIKESAKLIIQNKDRKVIVFGESISTANKVYDLVKEQCTCAVYHSGLKLKERRQMLQDYKDNKFSVMISCKALDEGLDLPAIELAIIISGSSVQRQFIQRVGRTLRRTEAGLSMIVQFFVLDSIDRKWLFERMKQVNQDIVKIRYE